MSVSNWHRVDAFGLEVVFEWPLPGARTVTTAGPRSTRVRHIATEELEERIVGDAEMVEERHQYGERIGVIERDESEYRFTFKGFGRYLVTLDGTEICCELGRAPVMAHERFVFAQVLPLAAALRGLELFHASAVCIGDSVAAFLGPSGRGKTTLMAQLVRRGAGFVTDDVLAVERRAGAAIAHPGPPLFGVVDGGESTLDSAAAGIGRVVGKTDKLHVSLATIPRAMPLGRLYHLEMGSSVDIAPVADGGVVHRLLAGGFAPYLATRTRLEHQLDIVHLLARDVPEFWLKLPRDGDAEAALDVVEAHLHTSHR